MARQKNERVTVALSSPRGGRVTVHPDRVDHYLSRGYRIPGGERRAASTDAPKGNASRESWAKHAESVGVEFDPEATRDEIKAAVSAAQG